MLSLRLQVRFSREDNPTQPMTFIVHAASYGNPRPGSFIPSIVRLAEAIRAKGSRLAFVTTAVQNATWLEEVAQRCDLYCVSTAAQAARVVRQLQPDIIHTHFDAFDIPLTLTNLTSNGRIFWHQHSMRTGGLQSHLKFIVKYLLLGTKVEAFVTASHAVADQLRSFGAPIQKVKTIANAVDLDIYRPPTEAEQAAARARLGLDGEDAILLFGRDIHIKGVDVFWEAVRELDRPVIILVGAPAAAISHIRPYAGRLLEIDSVQDVRELYWAANLLVMPSRTEALPYVLLEALACGLPVVASNLQTIQDVIHDLPLTYLVPVGDPHTLAAAISRAERKKVDRTQDMSRFGLDRWTAEILSLYGLDRA
jgi:glycosyltransferase involved in cell wall biosynthesis